MKKQLPCLFLSCRYSGIALYIKSQRMHTAVCMCSAPPQETKGTNSELSAHGIDFFFLTRKTTTVICEFGEELPI